MPFSVRKFSECQLSDPLFDSLKKDYDGFEDWFKKKSESGEDAYVYDENGIQAFLYIKDLDSEEVGDLPAEPRMKIGTLKIGSAVEGRRLGEGAIGIALWRWQRSELDQIYITVYPHHDDLIVLLRTYGFEKCGKKGGEDVFVRDKRNMRYDTVRTSFPYLNPNFSRGKYIPIEEAYHDSMFQYSDLMNTLQDIGEMYVSNGITKNFIATPAGLIDYLPGDVAFIYRKSGTDPKTYKSVVTSYCTVSNVTWVKQGGRQLIDVRSYMKLVGNKSVYGQEVLAETHKRANVCIIELVYNGYFGAGHNITHNYLETSGLFEKHPYMTELSRADVLRIMKKGGKDEHDIIIN